jgi:polysaccharide pyruvyl transferase WcaK-like protein
LKKIAILGVNYVGNVGDLYILDSILNYLSKYERNISIDIFPYPLKFDKKIAAFELFESRFNINIVEPPFAIYKALDHLARKFPLVENITKKLYFSYIGKILRSKSNENINCYDYVISVGGEMDIPYSLLDIHSYIKSTMFSPSTKLIYGPISITPNRKNIKFLIERFKEVNINVGIRDPKSKDWLSTIGIHNTQLVPDCAFLSWQQQAKVKEKKAIGVCLHASWFGKLEKAKELIMATQHVAINADKKLIVFCTNIYEDYELMVALKKYFKNDTSIEFIIPKTSQDLVNLVRNFELIISDRLHALLSGMINGANILPLSTRHKVVGYCNYVGLTNYISLDDDQKSIITSIENQLSDTHAKILLNDFCKRSSEKICDFYGKLQI